jgi:hypothetical protein
MAEKHGAEILLVDGWLLMEGGGPLTTDPDMYGVDHGDLSDLSDGELEWEG